MSPRSGGPFGTLERIREILARVAPRRRIRDEVNAEIEAHFEGTVELLVERGMEAGAAREEARRRFGDVAHYRARMERIERRRLRRRWTMEWIQGVRGGLAFAARSVRRGPGFAVAVVLTLALGIGANATMFGVVDRLLLRPPDHVTEPDDVRKIYVRRQDRSGEVMTSSVLTWADVGDFRNLEAFRSVGAWSAFGSTTMGSGEGARRIAVHGAGHELFPLLGVRPRLGRFFTAQDDALGAELTAVLSHGFWTSEYGADPDVLGRTLTLGGEPYTIIGVAPRGFTGVDLTPVDAWIALVPGTQARWGDDWLDNRGWWAFSAVARLEPDATVEVAEAQATAAHRAAREEVTGYDPDAAIVTGPIIEGAGPVESAQASVSKWLAGVSLVVLLIACFNVANLFLARAVRWRRELAVRLALGSSRVRLAAEFATESFVLAGIGAVVAVVVARTGGRALYGALLPGVAFDSRVGEVRILLFTLALAGGAALLAGVVPALHAARQDVTDGLKDGGGRGVTRGRSRLRVGLAVGQAALTAILLVGAGLFVRSLQEARSVDLGFDPDRVAVVRIERESSSGSQLEGLEEREPAREVYTRLAEALPRLPGVVAASRTGSVPFRMSFGLDVFVPDLDSVPWLPSGAPGLNGVGPDYFRVMGTEVLQGRAFERADLAEEAELVAVVNRTMAEHVWPNGDALGRCIRVGGSGADCARIVGVVEDHASSEIDEEPRMRAYTPVMRGNMKAVWALLVRTEGHPADHAEAIKAEARTLVPGLRFLEFQPMSDLVGDELKSWRLGASLFSLFGLLALAVASVGLYSVLAFDVAQRRHELGIRRAVGATTGRVVRIVVAGGARTVVWGGLIGLAVAGLAAPRVGPLLFRVSPRDPWIFGGTAAVLLAIGLLASWIPAWRATRVDPLEALRIE